MSDLVGTPNCWFSHAQAHISYNMPADIDNYHIVCSQVGMYNRNCMSDLKMSTNIHVQQVMTDLIDIRCKYLIALTSLSHSWCGIVSLTFSPVNYSNSEC